MTSGLHEAAKRLGLISIDCDSCGALFHAPSGSYTTVSDYDPDGLGLSVTVFVCGIECADKFVREKVAQGDPPRRWLCTEGGECRVLPCQIMSTSVG